MPTCRCCKTYRDWIHATRDGLSKGHKIRLDASPLVAEHFTSTTNSSLDLVTDKQHVMLLAQCRDLAQVVFVGYNYACLALDGFNNESSSLLAMGLKDSLKVGYVVVTDRLATSGTSGTNVWDVRAVVISRLWVSRQRDGRHLERSCRG